MDFQRDFLSWNNDRGIMPNTQNLYMYIIRAMMVIANEEKLTQNTDFTHSDFVPKAEEIDEIFLTPTQIQAIAQLDLSSQESILQIINKAEIASQEHLKELLSSASKQKIKLKRSSCDRQVI